MLYLDSTFQSGVNTTPRASWSWVKLMLSMMVYLLYGWWDLLRLSSGNSSGANPSVSSGTFPLLLASVWPTPYSVLPYVSIRNNLVQIWSLLNHSKNNFTRDYFGAISNLLHVGLIVLTLIFIIEFSTLHMSDFYAIFFSLSIMFVRNIIYMQLCVTAEMKYQQFQPSTVLFIVGYTCTCLFISSLYLWAR